MPAQRVFFASVWSSRTQDSRVAGARPNHQPIGGSDPNHQWDGYRSPAALPHVVMCLLLQDLVQSCSRGGGEDSGGHVLRETTSRGLCGLVCPSRTACYKAVREGRCVWRRKYKFRHFSTFTTGLPKPNSFWKRRCKIFNSRVESLQIETFRLSDDCTV